MKKIKNKPNVDKHNSKTLTIHNKKILIPLLFLGLILLFSSGINNVAAATAGSDNISAPSDNLTTLSSNDNQTGPDPDVISGGVVVYSTTSIQDAIDNAQTGDTIRLENGATFYEHDITIPGYITNLIFDVWNTSHTGPGGYATIDAQNFGRIITTNPYSTINFNNITFKNGNTGQNGGAIFNGGTLTVTGCTFEDNTATNGGGAIYNYGTLTVTDSTFTGNTATFYGGGAIIGGDLTVIRCTFIGNTVTNYYGGGAIYNFSTSHIFDSTFTNNNANSGGAIYNYGTLIVTGSTFTGNSANSGGAIYNNNNTSLSISNSTFTSNSANSGGAIYNIGIHLDINGSTFNNNSAPNNGGAIYNDAGIMNATNCDFTQNTTTNTGGAIWNYGALNCFGCTFTNNHAITGTATAGAILNYGDANIIGSTFTGNTANNHAGAIYSSGSLNVSGSQFLSNTTVYSGGAIMSLNNLTIDGSTFTNNGSGSQGGAVWNNALVPVAITNCTFTNNHSGTGGAVYNCYNGIMTVTNNTFTNNTVYYGYGGAIYNEYGTLTVNNNTFTNNTGGNGGAIYQYGGNLTVKFNRIIGNSSYDIYRLFGSMNADNNWWGTNFQGTNPQSAGRTNFSVSRWLVLTVTASPDTIPSDSTSTVTVDLQHDNLGTPYNPVTDGHVPDGTQVTFNLPSIGFYILPVPTTLTNGQAQVTYSSLNVPVGIVTVSATVDSQTQQGTITISGLVTNMRTLEVFNTIQAAINDPDTMTDDTLRLKNGTTFNESNLTIPGMITNLTFDVWNASHTGPGGYATIDAQNHSRILTINPGVIINIYNITFQNGQTTQGGAIFNGGTLNITGSTFTNNNAGLYGGAIFNNGILNITSSTFTGNTVPSGYGGAVYNLGTLSMLNCIFSNNSALQGGVMFNNGGTINDNGSIYDHNHASNAGVIFNSGTLTYNNCEFTENSATEWAGAISNNPSCILTINSCTFTYNTSPWQGGAIYNYGTTVIHFNRIVGNNNYDIYNDGGSVLADNNWWGTNFQGTNPQAAGRTNFNVNSWLILTITATPTTINYLGTSAITADLLHDSSPGHPYHDPALGHVPDGILVTFNPSWGTITDINPLTSTTINGQVSATYHGNGALPIPIDPVQVYANVDNEHNIYAQIIVIKPTITTVDNINSRAGQIVNLTANVNDNSGRPVNEGTVQFTVSSETPVTANVIGGIATYTGWLVPATWSWGNYPIVANYSGTGNYAASMGTGNLYLVPQADISITKVVNPGNANTNVGHSFNYTIIADNNGPDNATGVQITDLIPTDLTFNNYTSSQGTYNSSTGIWDIGTIANGAMAWINLNLTIKPTAAGKTIRNTATKTAENEYDPTTTDDTSTAYIYVPKANVGVNKYTSNSQPKVGQTFYYTIAVNNIGPDAATGVQITDILPSALNFLAADTHGTGTYNSSTGVWDIGTINIGVTNYLTLYVSPKASAVYTTLTNIATKTSENEYSSTPDSSSVDIYVRPLEADISITKTISNPNLNVGDTFNYTVTATNNGPDNATGLSVYDFISGVLTVNSINTSQGTYNPTTRLWTIGALANGASATMIINVTVKSSAAGHYIVNTAYKYAEDQYDPTTTDDKSTINTYVNPTAWTVTISQLETAATYVKTYYETHSSTLPANVKIGYETVTMPQLLQLLVTGTLNINNGNLNPITVTNVNNPTSPSGTNTPGNLQKNEYLIVAQNIKTFINTNGRAPNYITTSLGNINFNKLVYMYSKIINFYQTNNRLPNYVTI